MAMIPRPRFRPALEALEGRLAPAVHTWTGAAGALWSDAANWDGGSPAGDPEAELVFPNTAANRTNVNDLTDLGIRSIFFATFNAGYTLRGNAVRLSGSGISVNPMAVGGSNIIAFDISLQEDIALSGPGATPRLSVDGVIGGDHALTVTGWVHLRGANTYTGGTTILGTALTGNPRAFGTGEIDLRGVIYGFANGSPLANPYRVSGPGGILTGDYSVTMLGPGFVPAGSSLVIYTAGGNVVSLQGGLSGGGSLRTGPFTRLNLGGTNTYTGTTTFEGSVRLDSAKAMPEGTALSINGGQTRPRLELNGFDVSVGSLSGVGEVDLMLGSASLTTGSNNTSTTFRGVISGTGGVTKVGAGTWTLAGDSTFTGGLTVAGGTARLTGSRAAGAGSVTVAEGVLEVAANVQVPGTVSNAGIVVVEPGRALRVGRYEQSTGYTYLAGGTLAAAEYVYLGDGGYFGGSGTVEGFVVNAGFLDVGTTGVAATLTIAGDYTQTASGILRVELGSPAGVGHDRLEVTGMARLDGVLDVGLLDDFFPVEGVAYEVLTFGSLEGGFWFYNLPELGDGFFLAPIPDANGLFLYVARQ